MKIISIFFTNQEVIDLIFLTKLVITGFLLLLTVGSGFWLSSLGRPLNSIILNIHKLIALATVIYTGFFIRNLMTDLDMNVM